MKTNLELNTLTIILLVLMVLKISNIFIKIVQGPIRNKGQTLSQKRNPTLEMNHKIDKLQLKERDL